MIHRLAFSMLALAVFGCTVGPDYVPPEIQVPDRWSSDLAGPLKEGEASIDNWWKLFEDPVLDGLVQRAMENNLDLAQAGARIMAARANVGVAFGENVPTLGADASYGWSRTSENLGLPVFRDNPIGIWGLGLSSAWEIDVFGGIRRSVERAEASFGASVESYRDALVILLADVALNYVELRTLQYRLDFAKANAELQRGTLELTRQRKEAGLAPELDVAQAESNLAFTESVIPSLELDAGLVVNRLAVLVGGYPGELQELLEQEGKVPEHPGDIAVGIPANLLRQRPDVRAAERRVAAQHAAIGMTTAELYPKFGLLGSLGLESSTFKRLWRAGSTTYSLTPLISWNIFQGGSIRSQIKVEEALTEEAVAAYEQTVLLAVEEVENALIAFRKLEERRAKLEQAVQATQRSAEQVKVLYRTGVTNFQNVLDSERSLKDAQDQLAATSGQVVQSLIALYKALGGGWSPPANSSVSKGTSGT